MRDKEYCLKGFAAPILWCLNCSVFNEIYDILI